MVRSASVVQRGIPLSFHSDLPMCPADPMLMASFAVNRVTKSGRVAGPEQRIGLHDALRAVTVEAAYSWSREDELGSIEVGKIANLTVLDDDPYGADTLQIGEIPIRTTMFVLVEQRCSASIVTDRTSGAFDVTGLEHGCGCEVAVFIGEHMTADGWAA